MSLDDYLQEQAESGSKETPGVFTLNLENAAWKLAGYQLTDRSFFAVHLLAGAVANGSDVFQVTHNRSHTRFGFFFGGPTFTAEELSELSQPSSSHQSTRLREIGIALSALSMNSDIEFHSVATDRSAVRLLLKGGKASFSKVEDSSFPPGQSLVVTNWQGADPLGNLTERCAQAPLRLVIKGEEIGEPFEFGMSQWMLYGLYQQHGSQKLNIRSVEEAPNPTLEFMAESSSGRSFCLALVWPTVVLNEGWTLMSHGVAYRLPVPLVNFSFLTGVVDVSDLKKNISQTGFVEDESYHEVLNEVSDAVDDFFEQFFADPPDIAQSQAETMALELSIRYAKRPMPASVASFLLRLDKYHSNDDVLKRIGTDALASDQWSHFEKTRAFVRDCCWKHHSLGALSTALNWIYKEEILLKFGERSTKEPRRLRYYLRHIHEEKQTGKLPEPENPLDSLNKILCKIETMNPDHSLEMLAGLPHAEPIETLLKYLHLGPRDPLPEPGEGWMFALWVLTNAENGQWESLKDVLNKKNTFQNLLWKTVVLSVYRGAMPRITYFTWSARIRFDIWGYDGLSDTGCERLLKFLRAKPSDNHSILLNPDYRVGRVPLVTAQIASCIRAGMETRALGLFARALLLEQISEDSARGS